MSNCLIPTPEPLNLLTHLLSAYTDEASSTAPYTTDAQLLKHREYALSLVTMICNTVQGSPRLKELSMEAVQACVAEHGAQASSLPLLLTVVFTTGKVS